MIKFFRIIGWLEGISYILLLFVGVPLKYLGGNPSAVKALGLPHGILFILYVVLAFSVSIDFGWPKKRFFQALVSALLPLGTFYFDHKFLTKAATSLS